MLDLLRRAPAFGRALSVNSAMLVSRQALEVVKRIVGRIKVPMMDLTTIGDRSVRGLPDFLMEAANAVAPVPRMRSEIDLFRPPGRVWISPESDAVEGDVVVVHA